VRWLQLPNISVRFDADEEIPRMLTGEIRNQVDQIWNSFWTDGISNPLEVIEQITNRRSLTARWADGSWTIAGQV
jgi:hypothetical protein